MPSLLIEDALVCDGAGGDPVAGSVLVDGDRIVSVGESGPADRIVEADGRVVAPGFIDMHSHADLALADRGVLEMKLAQGVTSEVVGQDGLSCAPVTTERRALVAELIAALDGETTDPWPWTSVGGFLSALDGRVAQNVGYLIPHGTVRATVMGVEDRPADDAEIEAMRALVDQGMRDGGLGLSTGLSYPPAHASTTDEIVGVLPPVRAGRGLYVTHLRSYGEELVPAIDEALDIGRRADVPVHFSHFQAPGRRHHGSAARLLGILEGAADAGADVSFDVYPYEAASTMLTAFLPPPIRFLAPSEAMDLLADPVARAGLVEQVDAGPPVGMDLDWSSLAIAYGDGFLGDGDARLVGVAERRNETVGETVAALLVATRCRASVIADSTLDSDVDRCLIHVMASVGSDGLVVGDRPHPRTYGTFPRFLRRAQAAGLSLGRAVHAMTGRPARRLGLADRGLIRPGMAADLCLFDPASFVDLATYEHPKVLAEGMDLVVVNGRVVWEAGTTTGARPGAVLRGRGRGGTV
jgi:N-acyl-D-amino-acid deacylase